MAQLKDALITGDSRVVGRASFSNTINQIVTGTGTTAQDKGSGVSPRYFPAKWTFSTGLTAADGDIITIKIPVAGHDYGVFMSIDGGTNYYPIVLNGTGRLTTHYGVNTYITVIFEPTGSAASMFPLNGGDARVTVSNGVFRVINYYDSNSNDIGYYIRRIYPCIKAGSNKIFPYTIIMQNKDGRWESLVTSSSTGTGKTRNAHGFLLGNALVSYVNSTFNENGVISNYNLWSMHSGLIDHRYSFNTANDSTNGTTANKPIYIVGAINASDGLFYLDSTKWWTQTLPSSDDGKLYIYIGDAYDYYRMTFVDTQRIYWYKNGQLREYAQDAATVTGHTVAKDVPSNALFTDNNTTYTFANGTNGFSVTPSGGSAQTVTVTPSITNNVTGVGTSGYIAKFNGTNSIVSGPQLGSGTTTYLRNDGTWTTPANTTYTFTGGTNKFTVTPSGGTAQDVTITPSITNNVTGSGTSGYLTKFNGANSITNGPQLGSSTVNYLRNDGSWQNPKNVYVGTSAPTDSNYEVWVDPNSALDRSTFVNMVYPVGSIYISVNSTNPGTLFGVGTWVAFGMGRTLLGCGTPEANNNTSHGTISSGQLTWVWGIGDKGGAYRHTLQTSEMPAHSHTGSATWGGSHNHNAYFKEARQTNSYNFSSDFARGQSSGGDYNKQITTSTGEHSHSLSIDNTGGGGEHNNIMPYITVYMWQRTA